MQTLPTISHRTCQRKSVFDRPPVSASWVRTMSANMRPSAAFQHQPVAEEADTPCSPDDYLFVDKLRLVRPYYFDFKCFVKKRWEGMTLVQMFTQEFPMLTEAYYKEAFRTGRLRVEGMPHLTLDTPLLTSMCIRHMIHRHEPPVLAGEVQVLTQTDEFVAVVKPACMPVHTVGQYRKNTVLGVLRAQRPDLGLLYPTYRLDKPVSGLLLLAKTSAVAARMRKLLEERSCSKVYMARVLGQFPATGPASASSSGPAADASAHSNGVAVVCGQENTQAPQQPPPHQQQAGSAASAGSDAPDAPTTSAPACASMTLPSSSSASARERVLRLPGVSVTEDGWLRVDVPLSWDARTNHVTAVPPGPSGRVTDANAKVAVTEFRLVQSGGPGASTSTVECRPKTGRTHQIRVHLQYIGHPIANDTQYGGPYGPALAFRTTPHTAEDSDPPASDAKGQASKRPRREEPQQQPQGQTPQQGQQQQDQQQPGQAAGPCDQQPHNGSGDHSDRPTPSVAAPAAAPASAPATEQDAPTSSYVAPCPNYLHVSAFNGRDPLGEDALCHVDPLNLPESIRQLYAEDCYRVEPSLVESVCPHCPCLVPRGYPIDLEPLWLHALAYSGPGWAFEAPPPDWGEPGFVPARQVNLGADTEAS